jgi:hypothetical protein
MTRLFCAPGDVTSTSWKPGSRLVPDVHVFDEAIFYGMHVLDDLICNGVSGEVANDLADIDYGSADFVVIKAQRYKIPRQV